MRPRHLRLRLRAVADAPEISGSCDERFAGVRDALEGNFREHDELGAAVAVVLEGRPVVDIWAGWKDHGRTQPWQRDTLVDVFSVGKAMATICVLILLERGQVDLEAPVSRYWPGFEASGKSQVTVRMLLSHRAGLPAIRRLLPEFAMYDWDLMATALAAEEPWWEPGSVHGYHPNTFGFLVGEIVRRVSGESIGAFFRREVAGRLDADFHFGFGPEHDGRTAEYVFGEQSSELDEEAQKLPEDRNLLLYRAYMNPPGMSGLGTVNSRAWRAAEIPSANGHATARAVAEIYSALACAGAIAGVRLLRPETIDHAITEASAGTDFVLGRPSRFGLGFQLTQPERPLGPNPRSFGHFGLGGSLGFADPDEGLAFGYAMNRSGPRWQNPRNRALIDAVYASL
jgi:CubicO group peptidase (beta-lactamase class C family)